MLRFQVSYFQSAALTEPDLFLCISWDTRSVPDFALTSWLYLQGNAPGNVSIYFTLFGVITSFLSTFFAWGYVK